METDLGRTLTFFKILFCAMKHNLRVTVRKFSFGVGLMAMGLNQWTNGGRYMKLDTEINRS